MKSQNNFKLIVQIIKFLKNILKIQNLRFLLHP